MNDYFGKLHKRIDGYMLKYSDRPAKAALLIALWNFECFFRLLRDKKRRRAPVGDELNIAVRADGGMGDILVTLPYLSKFTARIDCPFKLTLVVGQSVASVKQMLEGLDFIHEICSAKDFSKTGFDFVINMKSCGPIFTYLDRVRVEKLSKFLPWYLDYAKAYYTKYWGKEWACGSSSYFNYMHRLLAEGKTYITGPDIGGELGVDQADELPIRLSQEGRAVLDTCSLHGRRFITFQRGIDCSGAPGESMRILPLESYEEIARQIKKRWPDAVLIQVGASKERCLEIKGMDLDLRGKTSFAEVMALLDAAVLHIDSECGMVHLRHFLSRKPSVVFFGPTSPKIKGYSENINIRSDICQCEFCEWLVGAHWQSVCMRSGSAVGDCIKAITPEMVMERIEQESPRIFGE